MVGLLVTKLKEVEAVEAVKVVEAEAEVEDSEAEVEDSGVEAEDSEAEVEKAAKEVVSMQDLECECSID